MGRASVLLLALENRANKGKKKSSYSFYILLSLFCWILHFPCFQDQLVLSGVHRVNDGFLETMMFVIFC